MNAHEWTTEIRGQVVNFMTVSSINRINRRLSQAGIEAANGNSIKHEARALEGRAVASEVTKLQEVKSNYLTHLCDTRFVRRIDKHWRIVINI